MVNRPRIFDSKLARHAPNPIHTHLYVNIKTRSPFTKRWKVYAQTVKGGDPWRKQVFQQPDAAPSLANPPFRLRHFYFSNPRIC